MRFLASAVATTALLAALGVATAADLPVKAAPRLAMESAPAWSWTGFYLGGNLGYGFGQGASTQTIFAGSSVGIIPAGTPEFGGPKSFDLDPRGVVGGAQFGYNWQYSPNWVLGLETDIQASGMKQTANCVITCGTGMAIAGGVIPALFPVEFSENSVSQKINWFGTLRGRLGYAWGSALFYITGGFAYADVERSGSTQGSTSFLNIIPVNTFGGSFNRSSTKTGWTVGGGIEGRIAGNWTAKAEYLYLDLGSVTDTYEARFLTGGGGAPGNHAGTLTVTSDLQEHIVRVGVNYKFGQAAP
jgi:outer membrane immunogenic protein